MKTLTLTIIGALLCVINLQVSQAQCNYTITQTSTCDGKVKAKVVMAGTPASTNCAAAVTSPYTCATGCNSTVSTNSTDLNVSSGVVCLTTTSTTPFTKNINITGGTLIICGTASPANMYLSGGTVVVNTNGSLTLNTSTSVNTGATIKNYGTLEAKAQLIIGAGATLQNYKTLTITGTSDVIVNGTIENYWDLTSTASITVGGTLLNSGPLTITSAAQKLYAYNTSTVTNNCTMTLAGTLINETPRFTNIGQIAVTGNITLQGGSTPKFIFGNNTQIKAGSLTFYNGALAVVTGGIAGCASFEVTGATTVSAGVTIDPKISLCLKGSPNSLPSGITSNCSCTFSSTPSCTYSWKNSSNVVVATTAEATGLTAGTYTVLITCGACSGFPKTETVTVVTYPVLSYTETHFNEGCTGALDGKITLAAIGGKAPLAYTWTNTAATTASISGLKGGLSYVPTIKDADGCTLVGTGISLITGTGPELNVGKMDVTVFGAGDGTASVSFLYPTGALDAAKASKCTVPAINIVCSRTISTDNGTTPLNVVAGEKVCITAATFTSPILFPATTTVETLVYVKGTSKVTSNISFSTYAGALSKLSYVVVDPGATLTFPEDLRAIPSASDVRYAITNYGTFVAKSLQRKGVFQNYGTATINGSVNDIELLNCGKMEIMGNASVLNSQNNFILYVAGNVNEIGGLSNNNLFACRNFNIGLNFINNAQAFANSANVVGTYTAGPNSVLSVNALSAPASGKFVGDVTTCGLISVAATTNLVTGNTLTGKLFVCDANGAEGMGGLPATVFSCTSCVQPVSPCTVKWSNGATTRYVTGLVPGTYTATVTCGTCVASKSVKVIQNAQLFVDTKAMGAEGGYSFTYPQELLNYVPTTPYKYDYTTGGVLEYAPPLPDPGIQFYAELVSNSDRLNATGQDLKIKLYYNDLSNFTSVRASYDGISFTELHPDFYTLDKNKIIFKNPRSEIPTTSPTTFTSNLVNGVLLNATTRQLQITLEKSAVYSARTFNIYKKVSSTSRTLVAGPLAVTSWTAPAGEQGLYEFELALTAGATSQTYKGQFIIE